MEPNIHDFKSNNRALLKSSDIVKYKQQINRSNTAWKTESQDAFRKFIFSPSKKTAVFQGWLLLYFNLLKFSFK